MIDHHLKDSVRPGGHHLLDRVGLDKNMEHEIECDNGETLCKWKDIVVMDIIILKPVLYLKVFET